MRGVPQTRLPGFSMAELAVVLVLLAALMVLGFAQFRSQDEAASDIEVSARIEDLANTVLAEWVSIGTPPPHAAALRSYHPELSYTTERAGVGRLSYRYDPDTQRVAFAGLSRTGTCFAYLLPSPSSQYRQVSARYVPTEASPCSAEFALSADLSEFPDWRAE